MSKRDKLEGALEALDEVRHVLPVNWGSRADAIRDKYRVQLAALSPEPEQLWTERERRLWEALERLTSKLDEVHKSREYAAVWFLAHLHDGTYCGPTYTKELEEAVSVLADTPPPDPRDEALEAAARWLEAAANRCESILETSPEYQLVDDIANYRKAAAIARANGGTRE